MAIDEMETRLISIERLAEELKKTEVLYAGCHRCLTAREREWFRGRK
jgi:hypothetical protein